MIQRLKLILLALALSLLSVGCLNPSRSTSYVVDVDGIKFHAVGNKVTLSDNQPQRCVYIDNIYGGGYIQTVLVACGSKITVTGTDLGR